MVYVLDTNTIFHYLRDNPIVISNLEAAIENGDNFVIPYVVDYEIRRGYEVKPAPNKEAHYDQACRNTQGRANSNFLSGKIGWSTQVGFCVCGGGDSKAIPRVFQPRPMADCLKIGLCMLLYRCRNLGNTRVRTCLK